jgi:TRAP-type C4-dicarboxylate transport system substrate-binding protein
MSTMRHLILSFLLLCVGLPASAQTVTVKLGTLAPDGSGWHLLLKEMAAAWSKASGGKVVLKIYPGGVAGNEGDMVRKMRVGQLHAAAITTIGMGEIDRTPQALSTPGLIATDAEWEHVFSKMTPTWEQRFLDKGFVVLMWGDTGWAHAFVKKPIRTPKELAGLKMFAWAGESSTTEAFKLAGFQPVIISATDMMTSLSTGMIEGFVTTPVMTLAARWYQQTPYMVSHAWGHLPGATLVTKATWEKIPADVRPELLRIAREFAVRVNAEVARMQTDAIAAMKKNGLTVIEFDAAGRAEWQQIAERTWPAIRGGVVSAEDFDAVKRARDEFRAAQK